MEKDDRYYNAIMDLLPSEEEICEKVLQISYNDYDGEYTCDRDYLAIAESREALALNLAAVGREASKSVYSDPGRIGEMRFYIFQKEIQLSSQGGVIVKGEEDASGFVSVEFYIPQVTILS